ncbi:MAG: cell wall-binding repeat-containing protein [Tissierellia bacterium]|nr:cell wall-binding repeat-containing protein [Tissierellia bacterium]
MNTKFKRSIAVLLAVFLAFPITAAADDSDLKVEITRIAGDNRYETSLEVSKNAFESAEYAIIANGSNFPDALAGGPLAAALDAPILLVSQNEIPSGVLKEIVQLKASNIIILGSTGSVSNKIESQLNAVAEVERLGGEDRYETAALIAERVQEITGSTTVAISNGLLFPDALSASAYLGDRGIPILLTKSDELPKATSDFFKKFPVTKSIVLGGNKTVSAEVSNDLPDPTRIAGNNRFSTAIELAKRGFEKPRNIILVNGHNFPDALSAVALSGIYNAPIILTESDKLSKEDIDYLKDTEPDKLLVVGGRGSVAPDVVVEIIDLFKSQIKPIDKPELNPNSFNDIYARQMAEEINAIRKENGRYELVWDDVLAEAAKIRAKEIVDKLSHTRPNGETWNTVSKQAKGENLAQFNGFPIDVVKILMSSSGHSTNILKERSDFKAVGIACWTDSDGNTFWVQLFGLPKE